MENHSTARNSKNRNAILEILKEENKPVTAEYLHLKLKEVNPSASMSTVYRGLEKLILNNLVMRSIIMDSNKATYEINRKVHVHYLICVNCNRMQALKSCPLHNYSSEIQQETGFNVTGHKLEIYGQCKDCLSKV